MASKYKRILLKLSGEQLAGDREHGIDPKVGAWLAKEVKKVVDTDCQVVIMVGGGNIARGPQVSGGGIKMVTGHQMGMLATLINAIALTDIFEANGVKTRCLSRIFAEQVAESFSFRLAEKHLERGRVIIVGGGTGQPYVTTDTGALTLGLEMDCEVVLKSTKVDGIYDKDPAKYADAKRHEKLSFQHAVENPQIKVMDKAALGLAMENNMRVIVFDGFTEDNLLKISQGENVGTIIQ